MSFVSYAQNSEDVMLWRALASVRRGFYIDVGAWSPDVDSVTRAFSDAGWSGINVEPNPHYFAQLQARRPADINLNVAIGDRLGTVVMNLIENSGLSTADETIAQRHAAAGWKVTTQEVGLTTLASIWDEHVASGQDVHFLKVDVEGFEKAVLAGNDWSRHRPWIVVVEATLPTSQTESHEEWEGILVRAGYAYVYEDGLNRYYLAPEHAELKSAFRYPPNVFDDVVSVQLQAARDRFAAVEKELLAVRHGGAADIGSLAETQRRIELAEASAVAARQREQTRFARADAEAARLRQALAASDELLGQANHRIASLEQQHREVLTSSSWRLTGPLRSVAAAIPRPVWSLARRSAKGVWWAMTPWRLKQRLSSRAHRNPESLGLGRAAKDAPRLDSEGLLATAGSSAPHTLWAPQRAEDIDDKWSAARWCLDLLVARPDLRSRFPKALSEGENGAFASWLQRQGEAELKLSSTALLHLAEAFRHDIAERPRQIFLFRADVRKLWPHGLTPPGRADLFDWFAQCGRPESELRWEEILWLFRQAAEEPALELVRAYLFTADWQALHPDGMTVFGRRAFSDWFASTYGASGTWLEPSNWPMTPPLSRQVRQAYFARSKWRLLHPRAFDDAAGAEALVRWVLSPAAGPAPEVLAAFSDVDLHSLAEELAADGVNFIGHFSHPCGLRVSAEALVKGLRMLDTPLSLRDIRSDITDDPNRLGFDGMQEFGVTVIHTQPEPYFSRAYQMSDVHERQPRPYRIAYWYWEFDTIPDSWLRHAENVDEVWAATEFVAKGLRERLSIPVKTLFPGLELNPFQRRDRSYFGLEPGRFTFLFNFHMNSVMERKNPLGLIRAFKSAFGVDEPVSLVIKTMMGDRHAVQMQELRAAAAGANIVIRDEVYSPDEVLSLMDACDAYVSLHRSEGLGLTMAEAMLLGKPVIATNYSGNVDFMDENNSLLVPYELVTLGRPIPPYEAHFQWAEPSVDHAAKLMRRVFDNQAWAREVGARGQASAKISLSLATAGRKVAARLAEIRRPARTLPVAPAS